MKRSQIGLWLILTAGIGGLCSLPAARGETVWEQLPDMTGPAANSEVGAFIAVSDFQLEDARPIVAVEWWGAYWNGQDAVDSGGFWIRFYEGVGSTPLSQEYIPDTANRTFYGYDEYYGMGVYEYHADLLTPFQPEPGQTYWVSIQRDLQGVSGAWWGWQGSIDPWDPWGSCGMQAFDDGGGMGHDWEPKGWDFAFRFLTSTRDGNLPIPTASRDVLSGRDGEAGPRQEMGKLVASDGAAQDLFGWSVAVSGDAAVVGSRYDDDNGHRSGSAYVFRSDGSSWVQEAKLLASDGAEFHYFGNAVAISGDTAVVGAMWGVDNNDDRSGAAYVFRDNGSNWVQEAKLLASDSDWYDQFGWSVAVEDDVAVVGASWSDDAGDYSGSAYVFRYNGATWVEEQKLLPFDGATEDWFGSAVAISGDTVVIGAQYVHLDIWTGGDPISPGSAYVFRYNGSTWVEEQKLLASDGAVADEFGCSVAVSGDVAVIGAHRDDDACPGGEAYCDSGSAYVFWYDGLNWIEQQKLLPSDAAARDEFGWSVALSGDTAVVGSYRDDDFGCDSGSAHAFHFDGASWVEGQKLLASDAGRADHFGISVALSGDTAVVGARCDADNGTDSGSAYVFSVCLGTPDGDMDGNGATNGDDIAPFVTAVLDGSTAAADVCPGDFSGNGIVDPADTADFVTALLSAS